MQACPHRPLGRHAGGPPSHSSCPRLRRRGRPLGKLPTSGPEDWPFARRYTVNLLVDNRDLKGAPVIYEDNPTLANLLGRLEHISALGALITDFGLIRPGALHRANGGYLLLDAERVLTTPLS